MTLLDENHIRTEENMTLEQARKRQSELGRKMKAEDENVLAVVVTILDENGFGVHAIVAHRPNNPDWPTDLTWELGMPTR